MRVCTFVLWVVSYDVGVYSFALWGVSLGVCVYTFALWLVSLGVEVYTFCSVACFTGCGGGYTFCSVACFTGCEGYIVLLFDVAGNAIKLSPKQLTNRPSVSLEHVT